MAWSKESPASRGYGSEWRRIRVLVLQRDGYTCQCEDCLRTDRVRTASHVDHKVSKADWMRTKCTLEGVDDLSNLRAINAQCHALKGIREKGQTPKAGADVNGMPLDPSHPWNLQRE